MSGALSERRFLFVCSQNKLRSPTAEHVFAGVPGLQTLSAGTNRHAENPLSDELVEWADVIFAMERVHRTKIQQHHRSALHDTKIAVLGIPDDFKFMDDQLVSLLKRKMGAWLP